MPLMRYFKHIVSNTELYLPYIYPFLMPILTMYSAKVSILSFYDGFTYWFFTGFLQFLLIVIIQKIIYSKAYNRLIRWLIVTFAGSCVVYAYLFLEINVFHFTERLNYTNKWLPLGRYLLNIPILIALIESIKSAWERKNIVIDNIALENENAKAQFNLLLQQINPHFLFNCLTVLQAMAHAKDPRTGEFIEKLAEVYHKSLKTEKGMVTLQEELDFFNAYMYLMNLRQENAIFVEVKVLDESLQYLLPSFSLQLLAENCIKHNIVSETRPLYIRLYQKDAKSLTISSNHQPKVVKNESFGIGLENLKKRYALEGVVQGVQIEQNKTIYSTTIKLL
jgi:two-component system, LytTR family, sensor kinase